MIVVTGAFGFIGSCFVRKLNSEGHTRNLIVVDDFYQYAKEDNLDNKLIRDWIHRDIFLDQFDRMHQKVDIVFHLGARTDTTSQDLPAFQQLNLEYSKRLWQICSRKGIPMIYASSAATYGNGEHGYDDNHSLIPSLSPLNPYAQSKQDFDLWVLEQTEQPPFWAGLKFFNVYGPNEYHKGRMASVVWHAWNQIQSKGEVTLFRSHKEGIADGEQQRDFIYVKDLNEVLYWLYQHQSNTQPGIYNLGTGKARSFKDLVGATFKATGKKERIQWVDTPQDIRDKYQYFTEANMAKLRNAGFTTAFTPLEEGVSEYVQDFLKQGIKIY